MGERRDTRKLCIDDSILHSGTLEDHGNSLEDCVQAEIGKVTYSFHKRAIGGMSHWRHVPLEACMCYSNCITNTEGRQSPLLEDSGYSRKIKETLSKAKRGLGLLASGVSWVLYDENTVGKVPGSYIGWTNDLRAIAQVECFL